MMAAAATRATGGPRRPFAPVVVSPPPMAENRLAREDAPSSFLRREPRRRFGACATGKVAGPAVLGGSGGVKAAKNCGPGSSPVCVSSKKTPAAAKRAPGTATRSRRRLDSCTTTTNKCSTPAVATYYAPRPMALLGAAEERGDEVRVKLSYPCSSVADQERRGSEAEASMKRAMTVVAMEEAAMAGLPEHGEGRVKYLVNTFERLLSLGGGGASPMAAWNRGVARKRKDEGTATATATVSLPATPRGAEEIDVSYPSIASSSEVSFPVIPGVACILDASDRTRIRRARGQRRQGAYKYNSTGGSSDRAWSCSRKVTRVTTQQPFRLRTEQRGKAKEGNFVERLRKMELEEERLRNPLAQGLPYTTDEPEIPAKPPTKEPTKPIDHVLHSEVRVVRRVKFDSQVAERNSYMEEVKLEWERKQKLDEEIEIKQLRKEQVPKAHPMPDFSKPFVPKRSVKLPTIPREPRFHSRLMRRVSKARNEL